MRERDEIRQNAVVRRLRSGTPINPKHPYTERELYSGKEYGVAYHSATIDELRKRARDARCIEAVKKSPVFERYDADNRKRADADHDGPAERVQLRDLISVLRIEVMQLPIRERRVIERCGMRGQKIRDYASEFGISERTVAGLWHRAIKRLRKAPRLAQVA